MNFYYGVVENREDPLKLGRCQVRIVGLHTHDKSILPTIDLPWATPMQPVISAAMNGIGWTPTGPVPGTTVIILFADQEQQQPVMIGTVGGIPQSKLSESSVDIEQSGAIVTDGGVLVDSSGTPIKSSDGIPITVGSTAATTSETAQPNLTEQAVPNKPSDTTLKASIITKPPVGSTSNPTVAEQNIKYLIDACDQVGLTSKYAKAAILGICGGESGWLCIEEGSYYSKASSLSAIFKRSFPTVESAEPFVKWQGTKADFFRKVYSPEGNGKLVGHKDPEDGAKYYGRGFNQITGKSLYQQLQKFLISKGIPVDFVNNPQSLVDDPKTSALATAAFYSLNVKHDINDPGYFQTALKRTGADANGSGYAKKQKFYEYFLGESVTVDSTNKPAADDQKVYTKEEVKDLPPAKQAALLEDRSDAKIVGFKDPKGKYPLRHLLDEPDTNRLARQVQKETAIEFKDSTRTKEIPAANDGDSWEQPLAPFGGLYPYNKVYESESGHLFVLDDTPSNENVSLYHKTGSFIDIDANGTQVNKIVGDGYTIIDRNGAIYIGGACNLTVGNSVNILVQGSADIQVDGPSTINLNNNVDIGIGGDLNMVVGGDYNLQVDGNFNIKGNSSIAMESAAITSVKAGSALNMQALQNASIKSNADMFLEASGQQNIKAGGNVNVDGAEFHGQEGSAGVGVDVEDSKLALTAPEFTDGRPDQFGTLSTPVRPSPPTDLKYALNEENQKLVDDYVANPSKYYNAGAAAGGVKPNYAGTPKTDESGASLIAGATASDLYQFLTKQLQLAESGYWRETGQNNAPSNANITRIWADLGYSKTNPYWTTDQTAWCMGFVNWSLKQCGYRYVQEAGARAIKSNPDRWKATPITDFSQAEPGDIALWNYGHVNFVYSNKNGALSFVGGNQTPKAKTNNPSDGDVSLSWPSGYKLPGNGSLVGLWRPSKV